MAHDNLIQIILGGTAAATGIAGFTLSDVDLVAGFILKVLSIISVTLLILVNLGIMDKPFDKGRLKKKSK